MDRLRDDLFPIAPPGSPASRAVPAALLAVALGTVVSVLRHSGVGALSSVWAEDASVFLQQALELGPLEALGRAYSGYLHLVPRVAAEVAAALPLRLAPVVFALTGAVAAAASGVAVFVASAGHLRSRAVRAALGAAVVVLPASVYETLNSAALAQWHLAAAAWWVALWRPRGPAGTVGATAWLALAASSSPLALALAPVLAVRVLVLRTWRDRLPALVWAAVCSVQVVAAFAQPSPTPAEGGAADLLRAYVARVAVPAVLGVQGAERGRELLGPLAAGAAVVVVLLALVAAAAPGSRHRFTALWLAGGSAVAFAAGVYSRGVAAAMAPLADGSVPTGASRFAVVPTLLLLGVVALALDRRPARVSPAVGRAVLAGSAAVALAVAVADLRPVTPRSPGPDWSQEVAEAAAACRSGDDATALDASPPSSQFRLELDCDLLAASASS